MTSSTTFNPAERTLLTADQVAAWLSDPAHYPGDLTDHKLIPHVVHDGRISFDRVPFELCCGPAGSNPDVNEAAAGDDIGCVSANRRGHVRGEVQRNADCCVAESIGNDLRVNTSLGGPRWDIDRDPDTRVVRVNTSLGGPRWSTCGEGHATECREPQRDGSDRGSPG